MKFTRILTPCVVLLLAMLAACGGTPKQSRCDVEVYSPEKQYSEAALLDSKGIVIDSTLIVKNDSIRFSRTDTAQMPYVATLRLRNPNEAHDLVYMPIVVEGGTVKVELTNDRISVGGTSDNDALNDFTKARLKFSRHYMENNPDATSEQVKKDISKFFADQALLYKDNVVGEHIYDVYYSSMTPEDLVRVKSALNK